ncbi:hypothetical protein HII36_50635, partial [Nonomuraea sp. NN258]|uniref:hypothetical protein n=1 Tax=Nonomuraea antri TaxID=2730852 RepID=UPI00156A485E
MAGVRVGGRPVSEILAEVRERDLRHEFRLIVLRGSADDPDRTMAFKPVAADAVGADWTVWDVESVRDDTVRLLVTEKRLDHNPLYATGGPDG